MNDRHALRRDTFGRLIDVERHIHVAALAEDDVLFGSQVADVGRRRLSSCADGYQRGRQGERTGRLDKITSREPCHSYFPPVSDTWEKYTRNAGRGEAANPKTSVAQAGPPARAPPWSYEGAATRRATLRPLPKTSRLDAAFRVAVCDRHPDGLGVGSGARRAVYQLPRDSWAWEHA